MFRYRMSTKPGKAGWVALLVIIGLLLAILAGQLGSRLQASAPPPVTEVEAGAGGVYLAEGAGGDEEEAPGNDVTVEAADPIEPEAFAPAGASPQVLIYHTHSHEAYAKQDGQDYAEVAKWRTVNNNFNVARVGEELAKQLSSKYGIAVLHDVTDNEYPLLSTSYSRSLKTMQKDMAANNGLKLLIDLHRDAMNAGIDPPAVTINGQKVARIMVVIGTGAGYAERPDWNRNLLLATAVTDRLNQFDPKLARKVDIKSGRYNQHVSPGAILIEVGHNQNTLDEALAAMPFLAQAIAEVYAGMSEPGGLAPAGTAANAPWADPAPAASPAAQSVTPAGMPQPSPAAPPQRVIVIEPETARATGKPIPTMDIG